jgi:hypothetical protein
MVFQLETTLGLVVCSVCGIFYLPICFLRRTMATHGYGLHKTAGEEYTGNRKRKAVKARSDADSVCTLENGRKVFSAQIVHPRNY